MQHFRVVILALAVVCFHLSKAQETADISGEWFGASTFLNSQSQLKFELEQEGDQVEGYFFAKNAENGDSIKAKVSGRFQGNQLTLDPSEIIYRSGSACVSKVELTLQRNNAQLTLSGKWKGDMRLITCAPFISGPLTLMRVVGKTSLVASDMELPADELADTDEAGILLAKELRKRTFHSLIIGINEYENENIQDLDHPINDARLLADVLVDNYTFQSEKMTFLENPTRSEIIAALDQLAETVTEKDNLLIFYAGHGIWNEQLKQGYWLPSDASNDSKAYWISNSTLRDYVRGIPSKHTLLISDACFSGGIFKDRAIMGNSRALLEMYKLPSRKAITSGTLKTVPDESVFMKFLLKGLKRNSAPLLSADQLFRSFKNTVINNSPNGQVPQYGPITQAGDEGGDFIFLKREE